MTSDSEALLDCTVLDGHFGPERLVSIDTVDGTEQVPVSGTFLVNSKLRVSPIAARNSQLLVELPSESVSGKWRVWVKREHLEN
ncbi:MAG: hypothetical protein WAT39_08255 [Planctomycetota bacterium]